MKAKAMNYKHDIFISYAHVDDEPFLGIPYGWVHNLCTALKIALAGKIGSVKITSSWYEVQTKKQLLTPKNAQQRLEQSAILMLILSPGYLASEHCMNELQWFLESLKGQTISSIPRIYIVAKNKIDPSLLPKPLINQVTFEFWKIDQGDRVRTLAIPHSTLEGIFYQQKVDDLSKALDKSLKVLCPKRELPSRYTKEHSPIATVFLPSVPQNLKKEWDSLRRYLEQNKVRVLPDYQNITNLFSDRIITTERFDLFIQLLNDQIFDNQTQQYQLAKTKKIPVLQWQPPKLDAHAVSNANQKNLLLGETVYKMNLEEFKPLILRELKTLAESLEKASSSRHFVFLNAGQADKRLAEKIGKIIGQWGLNWQLSMNEGKPSVARKHLRKSLKNCDALIVVYGEMPSVWVKQQFEIYQKLTRPSPVRALALYDGAPEEKDIIEPPLSEIRVLNCRKGIDEIKLRDFLSPLLQKGAV